MAARKVKEPQDDRTALQRFDDKVRETYVEAERIGRPTLGALLRNPALRERQKVAEKSDPGRERIGAFVWITQNYPPGRSYPTHPGSEPGAREQDRISRLKKNTMVDAYGQLRRAGIVNVPVLERLDALYDQVQEASTWRLSQAGKEAVEAEVEKLIADKQARRV